MSQQIETHHPDAAPADNIDKQSAERANLFAEKMYSIYENTLSNHERLNHLYSKDKESFDEAIDNLVETHLQSDPDFQDTFMQFRAARTAGGGDSFVPIIKAQREKTRELILNSLGLGEQSELHDINEAKESIATLTENIPEDEKNAESVLNALGSRIEIADGNPVYSFPYELMPASVIDKWSTYLASVYRHIQLLSPTSEDEREDLRMADRTRTQAHNSVTKDVHSILGFETYGWNFVDTRLLLAKMRETEITTFDAGLSEEAKKLVKDQREKLKIASLLAKRKDLT